MKSRLTAVALVLVILPTAILSLMAARIIRNWETLERERQISRADAIVHEVRARVQARLDDVLGDVTTTLADALRGRDGASALEAASARMRVSYPLVTRVFLFMSPWGFIYPEQKTTIAAAENELREALAAQLTKAVATAGSLNVSVRLTLHDRSFCFGPIHDRRELYGGYELDMTEFGRILASILESYRDGGFVVVAEGPGFKLRSSPASDDDDVTVSDSLDAVPRGLVAESGTGNAHTGSDARNAGDIPPVEIRLAKPVDFIRIRAHVANPSQMLRTSTVRVRLYALGVVILAAGVIGGVWLVLREAGAQIRRARSRADFLVGVSHDLRTPVSSIRMLAESLYLGRVAAADKRTQFLSLIVRECDRLTQLTERVLFFVRFGQEALAVARGPEDPREIVEEAVEAFAARHSRSTGDGVRDAPVVELADGLPLVLADRIAVEQVLLNLLDNAEKYGTRPAITGSNVIRVLADRVVRKHGVFRGPRPWVRFCVADRGPGLDRREQKRVFRRYYRGRGARDRNVSGVGLGLALCRHVMTELGGWIEVDSRVGEGTRFSVYLPIFEP